MSVSAAIVIPVYKTQLEWYEKIALQQALKVFRRQPICFIMPNGSCYDYLPAEGWKYQRCYFDPKYFANIDGYNALMLSVEFYQAFDAYDYILIYQLDAFVFSDQLNYFCSMGYDYIGAPWPFHCGHIPNMFGKNVFLHVGNGGFSLRKIKACIGLLKKHVARVEAWKYNEDAFFSYYGKYGDTGFQVAPVNIAYQFSWDFYPCRYVKKTKGVLPFGCHAWHRRNADFYVKAFALANCDLLPFRHLMESRDIASKSSQLYTVACHRFVSRIQSHRAIASYLPRYRDWNILAVGETGSLLTNKLLSEGVIAENVQYFDDQQIHLLVEKLNTLNGSNNLIVLYQDDELLINMEKYGVQCGKEFQSFWQYYIACAKKVLRKMMNLE